MTISDHISNFIIATAIAIGIFMPIAQIFDAVVFASIIATIAGILFLGLMTWQQNKHSRKDSANIQANARTYSRRFAITMVGYIAALFLSIYLLNRIDSQSLSIPVAILPMLPVAYGLWAYMQWIGKLDELQQRIQLEAIAFSLGMTGMVTFTIGFLENADVPQPGLIWVFPMIIGFWGIGQFIALRRYQ